ncbi:hypothetical protein A8L34_02420 [Bacillus sp. FJAT-27264]|nr:hypothetical protein A8L34_02420 [Bacillus sp. FJAT-27264]
MNYMPWFSQNFLQLRIMVNETSKPWLDFFSFQHNGFLICPWLEVQHIHLTTLQLLVKDPIYFLIDCLNLENYIYLVVDGSYIHLYNRKSKFPHPIFIYGYDLSKEIFYVADFFRAKFEFAEISFAELKKAYSNINEEDFAFNGAKLIKFRKADDQYSFDIGNFMDLLTDYIDTRDTRRRYRSERNYMMGEALGFHNVYTKLGKDINEYINVPRIFHMTSFHIFYEHKKALSLILKYLENEGYLKEEYNLERIINNSLILRNTLLKYSLKSNRRSIIRSTELLGEIKREEEALLKKCYEELRNSKL